MKKLCNPKREFASRVRLYINHKRVLEKYSDHYKQMTVAQSMGRVYDLFKMVKQDCNNYNMDSLCKMVLINENHLRTILPRINHPHYDRQVEKLEGIISFARLFKK